MLLKRISLAASVTRPKQVIAVATFGGARGGTVRIRVVSGRALFIDGLGVGAT